MATTPTPSTKPNPCDPLSNEGLCRCGHLSLWHTSTSHHTKCSYKGACSCAAYIAAWADIPSFWCIACSESYPDGTAAEAHIARTGHVLTTGPRERWRAVDGALEQMLEDVREDLAAALTTLPTRAPTAEEMAEDPTALDTCLSASRENLSIVERRLLSVIAALRGALAGDDCAHEATPSAPFSCARCGHALPRDCYERKADSAGVRHG